MVNFKKYNSLENHYNGKYLNKIPNDWKNVRYCGTEKLDGANLSLFFEPNQPMKYGKRSNWINEGEDFFNIQNVLPNYASEILYFRVLADNLGKSIRVYAELYGEGINGRIHYGNGKYIKAYDVMIDEKWLTQDEVDKLIVESKGILDNFFVKPIVFNNLIEALSYDVESHKYCNYLGNDRPIEGIVIRPYDDIFSFHTGERFIIKKKSIAFADQMKVKSDKAKEFSPEMLNAAEEFKRYITKNRMIDLFSKHGPIQEANQMGNYIKLFIEDAKIDYLKEHSLDGIEEKDQKVIFNVGRVVADMLRESMGGTFKT